MGLKFADGANDKDKPKNKDNTSKSSALDDLRSMLSKPTKSGQEAMPDDQINSIMDRVGDLPREEVIGMINTHDRLDDLIYLFQQVRENPEDKQNLVKFVSLIKDTTEKFSNMQLGSMISAGIAAIVELERRDKNGEREQ